MTDRTARPNRTRLPACPAPRQTTRQATRQTGARTARRAPAQGPAVPRVDATSPGGGKHSR